MGPFGRKEPSPIRGSVFPGMSFGVTTFRNAGASETVWTAVCQLENLCLYLLIGYMHYRTASAEDVVFCFKMKLLIRPFIYYQRSEKQPLCSTVIHLRTENRQHLCITYVETFLNFKVLACLELKLKPEPSSSESPGTSSSAC